MIRIGIFVSAIIVACMIGVSFFGFERIAPGADLPTHWNLKGEIDGYTTRDVALILGPALGLGVAIVFTFLPFIDPRREHVRASRGLYLAAWLGALALLAIVHAAIVLPAALGGDSAKQMPSILLYSVSVLLIVLGNFTAKSRSNWFMGVRTPWTLSSEHSWIVTNRASGWMLVLTGLAAIAAGVFVDVKAGLLALVGGALATLVVSLAISYFAWAKDPERGGA
jgi:uncharacterized membrane protein